MKDAMGHYTLEVIGACAFGIKCDALDKEDSHFMKVPTSYYGYRQADLMMETSVQSMVNGRLAMFGLILIIIRQDRM